MVDFDMYMRPLWDWCTELLTDPNIVRQFHWDAEQRFKYNGDKFERFIDEPWTADAWWELQVCVTFALFFFYILTSPQVNSSSRRSSFLYPSVCRQDKVIVIWDSEGLPRSCPLCKFTC